MTTTTITLSETGTPSRSKGRGWVRVDDTFGSRTGREITCETGEEIEVHIGVDLRRASGRTERLRETCTVVATGNTEDHVDLTIGSPQSYDARITGARLAGEA